MAISRLPPRKSELELQAIEEVKAQLAETPANNTGNEPQVTLIRAPDGSLIIRGQEVNNNETSDRIKELLQIIEKRLIPKWLEIGETLIFEEVREFTEQAGELGTK